MIALAALSLAPAAGAQEQPAPPQRVLVVLAHPDDELTMAPAIAALARQGSRVRLVYATPGDAGPGFSGLPKGEALGVVRRAEAECSGKALGAAEVIHLGFSDGKLADHVRDGSLAKSLVGHVAEANLVLTWGPDGGYGHADHRLAHAMATQIAQARPAGDRPRLLYVGIPLGSIAALPPLADWAETDPALLTAGIAYTPADIAAASKAAACHVTQFDEATRGAMAAAFDATIWRGKVHFRPAF
jgi:LmbE family N-acetylglucosaminyl deacetylase